MITSFRKHAAAAATALAFGGAGAVAAQAVAGETAHAAGFSSAYTCSGPLLGTRTAVLEGWLTSPGQSAVNQNASFQLHISSLSLGAPYALDSWTAAARIGVGGAENTVFRVTGAGGWVAPGQPLSGDLTGDWAPMAAGQHVLNVGGITVSANTSMGNLTAYCSVAGPRPVAETLSVFPVYQPYQPGWSEPVAPPVNVVVPYRPGWNGPGWHRPIVVVPPRHGGWDHGWEHHGGDHDHDHDHDHHGGGHHH